MKKTRDALTFVRNQRNGIVLLCLLYIGGCANPLADEEFGRSIEDRLIVVFLYDGRYYSSEWGNEDRTQVDRNRKSDALLFDSFDDWLRCSRPIAELIKPGDNQQFNRPQLYILIPIMGVERSQTRKVAAALRSQGHAVSAAEHDPAPRLWKE